MWFRALKPESEHCQQTCFLGGLLSAFVHVIDDDALFRAAIARVLKAAGYKVAVYESATQFLLQLRDKDQPGCILLDVQMPSLSGPELQERLARDAPFIPSCSCPGGETSPRASKP